MLADDRLDQRVLDPERLQLQQQALGQVEGADARRVEGAHERDRRLDVGLVVRRAPAGSPRARPGDSRPRRCCRRDSVAISRTSRASPRTSRAARAGAPGRLRAASRAFSSGELLRLLLVLAGVVGGVEVVLEVGVEVDLLERVALLLVRRGGVLRGPVLGLPRGLGGRLGLRLDLFLVLLEDRVLDQFLGEDFLELQPRHLQQLDRLLQRRRHDQPLRQPEVEFLFEGHERHRLSGAGNPLRDRSYGLPRRSRVQEACPSAGSLPRG